MRKDILYIYLEFNGWWKNGKENVLVAENFKKQMRFRKHNYFFKITLTSIEKKKGCLLRNDRDRTVALRASVKG